MPRCPVPAPSAPERTLRPSCALLCGLVASPVPEPPETEAPEMLETEQVFVRCA
jgi:hypothetical protein